MVCVPCIVIPVLLWVFHKWIQPFILKFWNPWSKQKSMEKGVGVNNEELEKTDAGKFVKKMIDNNTVMIFSKLSCGFCTMAKNVFDKKEISYGVEELDKRDDCNDVQEILKKMTGSSTVPRVFINGKCIGGGSETWSLENQGRLNPILEAAGVISKKND